MIPTSRTKVTRLTESDWRFLAELRLHALADSLGAHDDQYRQEAEFTVAQWRRRLREHAQFVAYIDGDANPVGLIGAQQQNPQTVYLYSLWVAPHARGHGVARALVGAAVDWSRSRKAHTVTLRVAASNAPARAVYRSLGFVVTASQKPPPPGELTMSLDTGRGQGRSRSGR